MRKPSSKLSIRRETLNRLNGVTGGNTLGGCVLNTVKSDCCITGGTVCCASVEGGGGCG